MMALSLAKEEISLLTFITLVSLCFRCMEKLPVEVSSYSRVTRELYFDRGV